MVPWTVHSAPEGWVVVPLNETELASTSSKLAIIPVKPVTVRTSKLTINLILLMACGFCCSSSFIVPSHDSVRTSALPGSEAQQSKAKATNSIHDMAPPAFGSTAELGVNRIQQHEIQRPGKMSVPALVQSLLQGLHRLFEILEAEL